MAKAEEYLRKSNSEQDVDKQVFFLKRADHFFAKLNTYLSKMLGYAMKNERELFAQLFTIYKETLIYSTGPAPRPPSL